jgi:hypothetical protein
VKVVKRIILNKKRYKRKYIISGKIILLVQIVKQLIHHFGEEMKQEIRYVMLVVFIINFIMFTGHER